MSKNNKQNADLFEKANQALRHGKENGKNKVVCFDETTLKYG